MLRHERDVLRHYDWALQEAQATARKRAKGALADLHAKATLAEGRIKEALGSLFGR